MLFVYIRNFYLIVCIVFFCCFSVGQAQFKLFPTKTEVSILDTFDLILTIPMKNKNEMIFSRDQIYGLNNFDITKSNKQQKGNSIIITYTLQPRKVGIFTLDPVQLTYNLEKQSKKNSTNSTYQNSISFSSSQSYPTDVKISVLSADPINDKNKIVVDTKNTKNKVVKDFEIKKTSSSYLFYIFYLASISSAILICLTGSLFLLYFYLKKSKNKDLL